MLSSTKKALQIELEDLQRLKKEILREERHIKALLGITQKPKKYPEVPGEEEEEDL
jgi:hypothetical protein